MTDPIAVLAAAKEAEREAMVVLLEVFQVAHRLSYSERQVRRLISDGKLTAIRLGPRSIRVHPSDLAQFIASSRMT